MALIVGETEAGQISVRRTSCASGNRQLGTNFADHPGLDAAPWFCSLVRRLCISSSLSSSPWGMQVPAGAACVVKALLRADPAQRATAAQICKSGWLASRPAPLSSPNDKVTWSMHTCQCVRMPTASVSCVRYHTASTCYLHGI